MFNALSTSTMLETVRTVGKFEPFLLTLFFPNVVTSGTESIHFDDVSEEVTMAPFVSPVVAGKVHREQGGALKSFKPAYVKPKHVVKPSKTLQRRPGEMYLGDLTPAQRRQAAIVDHLMAQDKAITYREEWMAAQAVINGSVTVVGEDYPEMVVDFERSAENNITLVGAARWSAVDKATYDPTDDLTNWAENASGSINVFVMGKTAWTNFSAMQAVKDKLDTLRGSSSVVETATKDLGMVTSFKGHFGDVEVWVYTGQYKNADGSKSYYLPEETVILGNTSYQGVRAYGAIQDVEANAEGVVSASRWPKNWTQPDPSAEYVMTQSAPLMVTPDANGFVVVNT